MRKSRILQDPWEGDDSDDYVIRPPDEVIVLDTQPEVVLYTADGVPLVRQRPIGFTR